MKFDRANMTWMTYRYLLFISIPCKQSRGRMLVLNMLTNSLDGSYYLKKENRRIRPRIRAYSHETFFKLLASVDLHTIRFRFLAHLHGRWRTIMAWTKLINASYTMVNSKIFQWTTIFRYAEDTSYIRSNNK